MDVLRAAGSREHALQLEMDGGDGLDGRDRDCGTTDNADDTEIRVGNSRHSGAVDISSATDIGDGTHRTDRECDGSYIRDGGHICTGIDRHAVCVCNERGERGGGGVRGSEREGARSGRTCACMSTDTCAACTHTTRMHTHSIECGAIVIKGDIHRSRNYMFTPRNSLLVEYRDFDVECAIAGGGVT